MNDTTTPRHAAGLRRLRPLRRLLALLAVTTAVVLVPVGAASARIEPGPAPSRITYQMPATPVPAAPAESTWTAYLVPLLAIALAVAVLLAVRVAVRRHGSSTPAAAGA